MLFGRQRNMVRRTFRPNENHHRDMRRKGIDRAGMLEASKGTVRRKRPLIIRMVGTIIAIFRGPRRR
jgi:hypothetical protein